MGEQYHLGGRVETDTVAMAAARQEQAGIQRRHRLERRHGDDPSQEHAANGKFLLLSLPAVAAYLSIANLHPQSVQSLHSLSPITGSLLSTAN
jgi:hypothetical protein